MQNLKRAPAGRRIDARVAMGRRDKPGDDDIFLISRLPTSAAGKPDLILRGTARRP